VPKFDFIVNNETNTYHKEIMRIIPQNMFIQIFVSQGMECEITAAYQVSQLAHENHIMKILGKSTYLY